MGPTCKRNSIEGQLLQLGQIVNVKRLVGQHDRVTVAGFLISAAEAVSHCLNYGEDLGCSRSTLKKNSSDPNHGQYEHLVTFFVSNFIFFSPRSYCLS